MPDLYPDDNSVAYQNPDLFAIDARLADRKARLKLAAKAAAEGTGLYATPTGPIQTPGFQSAVTGANIVGPSQKQPLLANLTPLIADIGNAIDQKGYEEDQSGYRRAEAAAAQAHMAQRPSDDADESTKLQWAQKGAETIPSLKPTMDAYVQDQIVKAPERQEARAERQATREATIAEAQRRQQEELQYRRERDQQQEQIRRDLAANSDNLRRDLTAAVHASSGDKTAEKASDYQLIQDPATGTVYRVGKKPGSPTERVEGVTGTTGADVRKDADATRSQIERSTSAINNAPQVEKLLGQVSASGLKSDIRAAAGYAGYSDAATQAEKAIKPLADVYLKSVPRFEGPQSDADTKSYKEAAANLADPRTTPEDRKAALQTVIMLHKQAINQARARGNAPNSPRVPPTSNAQPSPPPSSNVSDDDLVRMYTK